RQSISLPATSFELGICAHPHFSCDEDVIDSVAGSPSGEVCRKINSIHRLGRPAQLMLVSVWTACDSLPIRRPIWMLSSDIEDGFQATRISSRPNVDIISGSVS
ncbi:hypothetical protein, partial [Bradyrhizobium rifense]|uniref:hypothetical protein n=1 Tax=Bradyrhizobium rifense TaxID=515499 RepID=UPI001AEDE2A7